MFRNRFNIFARFAPDTPQGGTGDDSGSSDAPAAGFQRLLERHSDASELASKLFDENYRYRARIRQLEQQTQELQGKLPGEGALVLTGDDAKAFEAYKALGDLDTVKQGLTQASELQGKLDRLERDATLRTVAETERFKPSVLARLDATARAEGKELAFEIREVEQDGEKHRVAFVKDGDTEKSLADYATTEWADFLPALAIDAVPQGGQPPSGTRFPAQNPAPAPRKQETTKAVADSYIKNTYRRANNGSNRND